MSCFADWKAPPFLPCSVQPFPSSKPFSPCFCGHSLPWLSSQVSAYSSSTTFTSSPFSACALCGQLIQLFLFQNLPGPSSALVFNFQPQGPCLHAASAGGRARLFPLPDSSSSERLFVFFNTHTHTHPQAHTCTTFLQRYLPFRMLIWAFRHSES